MSTEDYRPADLRYISGHEMFRYVNAKNIDVKCHRCGHEGWKLHDTTSTRGTAAMLVDAKGLKEDPLLGKAYIAQVALTCDNCGTMWFLSRGYVEDWLDANPRTGGIVNSDKDEASDGAP